MITGLEPPVEVGCPIPANEVHAVSVTLPSWDATVGYEEGQDWVVSKMNSGYPRFFIHSSIQKLCDLLLKKYGRPGEKVFIFPTYKIACQCRRFVKQYSTLKPPCQPRVVEVTVPPTKEADQNEVKVSIALVLIPESEFKLAKAFWQHSGDGISSRLGEYCLEAFLHDPDHQLQVDRDFKMPSFQSRHYSRKVNLMKNNASRQPDSGDDKEIDAFVEERFGRNLDFSLADFAKVALRRRIATAVQDNDKELGLNNKSPSESDVYLFPTGMSAIFNAHRYLLACRHAEKSVCYGFPYTDTLKILEKFGPGAHFLGLGDESAFQHLKLMLERGDKILAVFCEFPSNPLLKTPDLRGIKELSDKYEFAIVVDDTIGNISNVHVLPFCDMVASSLTKVFSGDSNVMGGSLVINPQSKFYDLLKTTLAKEYEDGLWAEDAIFLERNSRDFVSRSHRMNINAEAVADVLKASPAVKQLYYPKYSPSRKYYDDMKTNTGGYGALLSVDFEKPKQAVEFFDSIRAAKGPSLGTNFTLLCPYAVLAHFAELDWVEQYGVDRNIVRISVGLEPTEDLIRDFKTILTEIEKLQ